MQLCKEKKFKAKMWLSPLTREIVLHTTLLSKLSTSGRGSKCNLTFVPPYWMSENKNPRETPHMKCYALKSFKYVTISFTAYFCICDISWIIFILQGRFKDHMPFSSEKKITNFFLHLKKAHGRDFRVVQLEAIHKTLKYRFSVT